MSAEVSVESAPAAASRPLKVAILSPCFWPEVRRGGERIIRELADDLITLGHEPRLITSHPGPPAKSVEDGLPIVRNWRPPEGRLRRRRFEDYLTHVPFSYLSLRAGDDDVAHAVYPTDALAAARWTRETGRPSVLAYLGIPDHSGLTSRRYRAEITRRAVQGCSAVTALSRTAAEAFQRWLGVDARVIYPGVDLASFSPGGERHPAPTIFCAAATDEPRKRADLLAEAFALVRRERRDARLLLMRAQDPERARRLEAIAPGLEWVDPVQDPAELAPVYSSAWLSALPSTGDSFGLVLVEALACGRPVVGTRHGAIPEVVDRDSIGRLFDGGEPRDVARALLEALELAEDPSTPGACRARAEDFSTMRSAEEYQRLYRELLG